MGYPSGPSVIAKVLKSRRRLQKRGARETYVTEQVMLALKMEKGSHKSQR